MSEHADMTERHAALLGELAELGMSLARELHARAVAAETPEEAASLAGAFHRLSRSVRQSLALEAKLTRDAARAETDARAEADRTRARAVDAHRARVRAPVERLVWTEAEDDREAEALADDLDDLLAIAALADDFLETPVAAHVARLCAELGLAPPPPTLAPGAALPDAPPDRRSG